MSRRGAWLHLLALLALASSILVPPGYMVARAADGALRVQMCNGAAATLVIPGVDAGKGSGGGQDQDDGRSQHGMPCPYANAAMPMPAPDPPGVAPPSPQFLSLPLARPARGMAPGRGMAAPPPPSQAPPISSH